MAYGKMEDVLQRFQGVKAGLNGRFAACCPAHDERHASLSITRDASSGKILIKCFAGCDIQEILKSAGLSMADLFPEKQVSVRNYKKKRVTDTYTYTNESGETLYQVLRCASPKEFICRRPDKNSQWIWNMQGVSRTLYKLPQLIRAANIGSAVYLVEGEKDVHTLNSLGFTATTSGNAASWRDEFADYFKGADVVLIPDNDEAGQKYAEQAARSLFGKAKSVKVLLLPGLETHGDVTDWLKGGGDKHALMSLADECPEYKPQEEPEIISGFALNNLLTDTGNAEVFVKNMDGNLRYDVNACEFLLWNGKRWAYDRLHKAEQLATETVQSFYADLERIPDIKDKQKMLVHIRKSRNAYGINSMLERTKDQPDIPITADMLDTNPMLLNCLNGTIDLKTGELQPHNREMLITKMVEVDYNPEAACSVWERFIEDIFCGDSELMHYVQKALGYSLTGSTSEQVFFIFYGKGSNGKSTLLETISSLLKDYHKSTQAETFIENDKNSSASYDIAKLPGTRIITAIETKEGRKFNEQLIKQITGGDTITARAIYGKPFDFKPQFKLFLAVNHLPTISGQDAGMWRRVKPVPFNGRFEGDKADKMLKAKLATEYQGILNWLVRGCLMWQEEGLSSCNAIENTKDKYKSDMDILGEFFGDCCIIDPQAKVKSSHLFKAYQAWAMENGIHRTMTQTAFSRKLEDRGNFIKQKNMYGALWQGIGLKEN